MIDNNQIKEARTAFVEELMKQDNKQNYNVYSLAKQYIKKADGSHNGILQTVQNKHGKQFLCNGFSLIIFNNYIKELEQLPQTINDESLEYYKIYDFDREFTDAFTDDELLLLNNLTKYKKLNFEYLYIRGLLVKTEYMLTLWKFANGEPATIAISTLNGMIAIKTNSVCMLLLACRATDEEKEKQKNLANDFIQQLKNCNNT